MAQGLDSLIKTSWSSGEISPQVWGRPDMKQFHNGCSVMRNAFVNYRGGASSRAGLAYVGACKQDASAAPPRNIPFRFSATQSYVLEFGDQYMRVIFEGAYVTETPTPVTAVTKGNPISIGISGTTWGVGDWIFFAGLSGTTQLNNRTLIIRAVVSPGVYTFNDIFGNPVNGLDFGTWTGSGTGARIYTKVSPYAAVDLPYLKYTQSADVMSLCCVNQETLTEYPPYDLARHSPIDWTFTSTTYASSIAPPSSVTAVTTGGGSWWYQYVVTAVDATTGDESVQSAIATVQSVNIATTAGTITITWSPVIGAGSYNIYRAPVSVSASVPLGGLFQYVGTSYGVQFADSNITPSPSKTPPIHMNPFARGQVRQVNVTNGGSGYVQATTTVSIVSATGTGAALAPVVISGALVDVIILNAGANYAAGDPIVVGGAGSNAVCSLVVGPTKGTYPGVVSYFQQRRVYAFTLNQPDTYWASQTGSYTNMDQAQIPIDSDAVTGTPWAVQVNGIQWLLAMPGGLLTGTGDDVWQLTGAGGFGSALTPASQQATPQESYGFSKTVPPIKIGYNILYNQPYGSAVREMQYNYYAQIYLGVDISFLSNHLLQSHQIIQWAWAREPYKVIWSVREDGQFLSLTYLKEQEINGWARHDTNGLVKSVCVVSEPPVDAVYMIVRRYIIGEGKWMYYQERMDNRLWETSEDPWCIDAGISLPQPKPAADLTVSSATGPLSVTSAFLISGGSGYSSSPNIIIMDPTGNGSGAEIAVTVAGGVISTVSVVAVGSGYQAYKVIVEDPTGRGASIGLVISSEVFLTATQSVFNPSDVGSVVRTGGGHAVITTYLTSTQVAATLTQAIVETIPNDPNQMPTPQPAGSWTMTAPVTKLTNCEHLEGMTVSILADGSVCPQQVVTNGTVTLPYPASDVKLGLPFTVQVQTLHADKGPSGATIQAKRKRIASATVRVEKSRGIMVGANQPSASALQNNQEIPWSNLIGVKDRKGTPPGTAIPLYTGDWYVNISDDWNVNYEASPGMLAMQQTDPLPMNILMTVSEVTVGDG